MDRPPVAPVADEDAEIAVLAPKVRGDLGFDFQVRATGRRFRVMPARCADQPRRWCFRVWRCTPGGSPDPGERPWSGGDGVAREDLPAAVWAIRDDVAGWLARAEHRALCGWVLGEEG